MSKVTEEKAMYEILTIAAQEGIEICLATSEHEYCFVCNKGGPSRRLLNMLIGATDRVKELMAEEV